ncbi:MAG: hypothetical protein DMF07_10720 [Verrucomicrobia bacterium]|nr:MAG: hypothetical protein DMF07_10720 [Verrucomicrobiota bacterium]
MRRVAVSRLPNDDPKRIETSLRSVADRDGATSERSSDQSRQQITTGHPKVQKVRTDPDFAQCHVDAAEASLGIFRLSSFRFSLSQLLAASQLFEIP